MPPTDTPEPERSHSSETHIRANPNSSPNLNPDPDPVDHAITDIAEPIIDTHSRWKLSLIWVIPLLTAMIGISLILKSLLAHGPTIMIHFQTAEGLEPGNTKVKYKNVEIGEVKAVTLSQDLSHVLAEVELTQQAQRFAVADTRFWIVRPRVAATGVSGLNTLVSGSYIGADIGQSTEKRKVFVGLEIPPAITADQKGRQFVLHSDSLGSLDIGSPVFYRRVQVGRVVAYHLDHRGQGVTLRIFVNAPYDQYVEVNTRFWHASGINFRLGLNGLKLNSESLAAIMIGGIAFQTPPTQHQHLRAADHAAFHLAANESDAMRALNGQSVRVVFHFDQTLRGLAVGAPVDFRGIVLGQVESIDIDYDPNMHAFQMPVVVTLYPERFGPRFIAAMNKSKNPLQLLATLVKRGLRAQLRIDNLVTGQLYIALDFFPQLQAPLIANHKRATSFGKDVKQPFELPTIPNTLDQLQLQMVDIIRRLNKVPFDQIGSKLNSTLKSVDDLFTQLNTQITPQVTHTLTALQQTFDEAGAMLQQDAPLQSEVHQTLIELTRTLQSLNTLVDYLARHPEALIRGKQREQ